MYSQFGEDEFVAARLDREVGTVVDIGAGDGQHLSNSALFRERGWLTILVEPDPQHLLAIARLGSADNVVSHPTMATPSNINALVPHDTNFLSIDVDGDDYFLLEALEHRPEIICVEFNPTMPRDRDIHQARLGLKIGASIPALARVARGKGYELIHATVCNAIFERGADDVPLPFWTPDYVVATDYFTGRPFVVGEAPWGVDFTNPVPADDIVIR